MEIQECEEEYKYYAHGIFSCKFADSYDRRIYLEKLSDVCLEIFFIFILFNRYFKFEKFYERKKNSIY